LRYRLPAGAGDKPMIATRPHLLQENYERKHDMADEQDKNDEKTKQAELQAARDAEQLTKQEEERARLNAAKTFEMFTTKRPDEE
jgi:hypothetical protein